MAKRPTSSANRDLQQAIKDFDAAMKSVIQAGVASTYESAITLAQEGQKEVRRLVDHPGSYKPYYDKSGNLRISSQPGEPPASGPSYDLYKSAYSRVTSARNANPATSVFGVTVPYAEKMEYGTERVAPRPFMRPALSHVASIAEQIVGKRFYEAMIRRAKKDRPRKVTITLGEGN